jgi:hypothetical protein
MNETEARTRLSDLVAATVFPTLDAAQLDRLLRDARRVDTEGYLPSDDTEWAPTTVYALDDLVVPILRNGHVYRVTTAGTSGVTEPVWPVEVGSVVTLDGVEYTEDNAAQTTGIWTGTWDFNRAAAEGWQIKAGMVTNRHAFGSNQGNYNPEQVYDHCMKMVEFYRQKIVTSIRMASDRWDGSGRLNAAHYEDAV